MRVVELIGHEGRRSMRRFELTAAQQRVAAGQLGALAAIAIVVGVDQDPSAVNDVATGSVILVAFTLLRIVSVSRRLVPSTLVLDAIGTSLVLAGTGAPTSSFSFLAVAGGWWAAHVGSVRHGGALYAAAFGVMYVATVFPSAVGDMVLVLALEDVAMVGLVGVLGDWFVRVDRRAVELSETLSRAPVGFESMALRQGVSSALGSSDVPVDVVLAAARAGLTVIQAELLAYLVLGLTNQEIADATNVSVATVRYRLTRLYRALGVSGRREAAASARHLWVSSVVPAA